MLGCVQALVLRFAVTFVLLVTQGASAADGGDGAPAYRAAVEEAVTEYSAGRYEEARALFARAHELYPNARTLPGMALVSFELRRYVDCIEQLDQALRSRVKPLTPAMRADARRLRVRAQRFVARIQLETAPPTARLQVDGVPETLASKGPLLLAIGDHVLEVDAPGYAVERRKLRVVGGESRVLAIQLEPLGRADANLRQRDGEQVKRWYKNPWLWTAVGLVVVGGSVCRSFFCSLLVCRSVAAPLKRLARRPRLAAFHD